MWINDTKLKTLIISLSSLNYMVNNLIENEFEYCNLTHFNNDVLKKFSFFNHYYLSHTMSK
jgi:hypothetical protein